MFKVGITGGIGSGKSTIVRFFECKNVPAFIADTEAKILMNTSPDIRGKFISTFGENIYQPDSTLDRKKLAELIFDKPSLIKFTNDVVHPEVKKRFENWVKNQNFPYIIHEAAILFETGFYKYLDYTILVTAPLEMRIERVMKRDKVSREKVEKRISNQWPDEKKIELANCVLTNDNKELLLPILNELHESFLNRE